MTATVISIFYISHMENYIHSSIYIYLITRTLKITARKRIFKKKIFFFSLFFVFIYIIFWITSSVYIYFEFRNWKIQDQKILKMRSHNCILFIYWNSETSIENHRINFTSWYYHSHLETGNVFHIYAPFFDN